MDDEINKAIEVGERNRSTLLLVRNWCSFARIKKYGGVGIIEQQTGLPIGHHGLECDHATAGGIFAFDLREAALDFYDRNCIDCTKRNAVGIPNLGNLVKERNDQRELEAQMHADVRAKAAEALDARRKARGSLRIGLNAITCAIIDNIEELTSSPTNPIASNFAKAPALRLSILFPRLQTIFST